MKRTQESLKVTPLAQGVQGQNQIYSKYPRGISERNSEPEDLVARDWEDTLVTYMEHSHCGMMLHSADASKDW